MQRISTLVRTLGVVTLVGMTSFAPPLPAQAGGVHVSVGVGLPVVVAPAPVVVAPPPTVVYPAPVVVGPGYYGYYGYRPGYWRHGYRHGYWRHHPHHRWHRGHLW